MCALLTLSVNDDIPPSSGYELRGPKRQQRERANSISSTGSISGRFRSASDLEENGVITKLEKGVLKDMIIMGDEPLQSALDSYERGDATQLEALIQAGTLNRKSSLDLADDLTDDLGVLQVGFHSSAQASESNPLGPRGDEESFLAGVNFEIDDVPFEPSMGPNCNPNDDELGSRSLAAPMTVRVKQEEPGSPSVSAVASTTTTPMVAVTATRTATRTAAAAVQGIVPRPLGVAQDVASMSSTLRGDWSRRHDASAASGDSSFVFAQDVFPKEASSATTLSGSTNSHARDRSRCGSGEAKGANATSGGTTVASAPPVNLMSSRPLVRIHHIKSEPTEDHTSSKSASMSFALVPALCSGGIRSSDDSTPVENSPGILAHAPSASIAIPGEERSQKQDGKHYVGAYSPESRRRRIERFLEKRKRRVWTRKVKYDVRKNFADTRMRVKGRFVKKEDEDLLKEMMSLC